MRKILLITFLFSAINLFAQQTDSTAIQDISELKNTVAQQQQEIEQLKTSLSEQQTRFDIQLSTTEKLKNQLEQQKESLSNFKTQVGSQKNTINQQNQALGDLQSQIKSHSAKLDSLGQNIRANGQQIVNNSKELGTKIEQTDKTVSSNNSKILELNNSLSKNQLYWIIAVLVILLMGGFLYWLLGKRMRSNKDDVENQIQSSKTDVETQIRNTKASLEEESVKLDNKLIEVLETQLKLKQEKTKAQPVVPNEKADHSLALKVADEIIRIQKNLSRMDESTRGLKQLNSSVKRIQNNFAANGYELVEMLGEEYNEGMKVTANFIPSENVESGKEIITRIIKPQVNFKGEMIQAAQIEVSVGE